MDDPDPVKKFKDRIAGSFLFLLEPVIHYAVLRPRTSVPAFTAPHMFPDRPIPDENPQAILRTVFR